MNEFSPKPHATSSLLEDSGLQNHGKDLTGVPAQAQADAANAEALVRLNLDYRLGCVEYRFNYWLRWGKLPNGARHSSVDGYLFQGLMILLQHVFKIDGATGRYVYHPEKFEGHCRWITRQELHKLFSRHGLPVRRGRMTKLLRLLEERGLITREHPLTAYQRRALLIRFNAGKLIAILNEFFPRTRKSRSAFHADHPPLKNGSI